MNEEKSLDSEMQKLKEDLESLEVYIKEFSEFLPLPICMVNPLNLILGVNQSFKNLTGWKEIEVGGQDVAELFLEKNEAAEFVATILDTHNGLVAKEMTLLTKDKRRIPVNVYQLPRKDDEGNFVGYFLALSDISELKKFQESLEERVKIKTKDLEGSQKALVNILEDVDEARIRAEDEKNKTLAVINNFADGLLILDKKNNVYLVNPRAELFLEIEGKNILNKATSIFKKFPKLKLLLELFEGKVKEIFREELKLKDNLVLEVTTTPIYRKEESDNKKEKIGTLIVLHDITREKMVEKMKTEFVSLAAHQLRTPLSSIKWSIKMILDEDMGKITDEQRGFLEKTYESNERMISLINDLLNVTKIEEGRYISGLVFTDIENIIKSVIDLSVDEATNRELKIEFKKPKQKLPLLKIDAEKIQLSFQNLLDNAIRYTPKKGTITVSLVLKKDEVEVCVKDSGIGIPEDQKDRVFSKFFRAYNVLKKDTEGTGLGLFICKNIIQSHGGKIWFESEENKGSSFYFTLPITG